MSRRSEAVDLGLGLALGIVALLGLTPTFTGLGHLVAGLAGLLVGGGVVLVVRWRRWPAIAAVVLVVLAFFLLGPLVALRSEGALALLPLPAALSLMADQVVHGWKDLLTTLPPVDGDGPLLVLPWLLGLLAGGLAVAASYLRRGPEWLVAVAPVVVLLGLQVAVILLGTRQGATLWVQGAVMAALALAWLLLRAQRSTVATSTGGHPGRRLAAGLVLVAVAGALAFPVGARLVGADDERLVLRTYVEPPFDIGDYPSPLASFRRYVWMPEPDAVNLHEETLLTVRGVPAGTRIRFAALDRYDGVVWSASADSDPGSGLGTFQRVSSRIANPATGASVSGSIELGPGWSGVWLPTVGALTGLDFEAGDVETSAAAFRYNLATSTGVVPTGLRPGDRYRFSAVRTGAEVDEGDVPWPMTEPPPDASGFLQTQELKWTEGSTEPLARVLAVADHLRTEGKFSDGVVAAERRYLPGHHVRRLNEEFVNAPIMVGNAEQYAAVMALLANRIGVPARVVMGAVVPQGGIVQGKDVTAWVELRMVDGNWATLPTEAFMDTDKPADQPPQSQQEMSGTVVPPPAPIPPPSTIGEQTDAELNARKGDRDEDESWALPGWLRAVLVYGGPPLLAVLLVVGAIIGAKVLRRRRRRTASRVSARFVGGWREVVDTARDLGRAIPGTATRREQSSLIEESGTDGSMAVLARSADAGVFGPEPPGADDAARFWESVDAERRTLRGAASRRRRLRAALSLRSFRR